MVYVNDVHRIKGHGYMMNNMLCGNEFFLYLSMIPEPLTTKVSGN